MQNPARPSCRALSSITLPSNDAPPIFKEEQDITDSVMDWLHKDNLESNSGSKFGAYHNIYSRGITFLYHHRHSTRLPRIIFSPPRGARITRSILPNCRPSPICISAPNSSRYSALVRRTSLGWHSTRHSCDKVSRRGAGFRGQNTAAEGVGKGTFR